MRVFISWSGDLSRRLADAIRRWLPSVLQAAKPYFTPSDIEKGAKWDAEISEQLKLTDICIIALTKENLNSPWIMFEAGAISRTVDKARVCPIVFDLRPTDVQGPLARFQATRFVKEEMRQLLSTINLSGGEQALTEKVLDDVFEMWWPRLEKEVSALLSAVAPTAETTELRPERELMEETLQIVRNIQEAQRSSNSARLSGEFVAPITPFRGRRRPSILNALTSDANVIVHFNPAPDHIDLDRQKGEILNDLRQIAPIEIADSDGLTMDLIVIPSDLPKILKALENYPSISGIAHP